MRPNWIEKKSWTTKISIKNNPMKGITEWSWQWWLCPNYNFWLLPVWTPNWSFGTLSTSRKKESLGSIEEESLVWLSTNSWFYCFLQASNTTFSSGTLMLTILSIRCVDILLLWSGWLLSRIPLKLPVWTLKEISVSGTSRNSTASSTVI